MAKVVNLNRNVQANLVSEELSTFGKHWPKQYSADGFSLVNITAEQAPTEIKSYLEGSDEITAFPVASNVTKLCKHALASFPNIEDIYLFSTTEVTIESEGIDALSGDNIYFEDLVHLEHIYVPKYLISSYQSIYPIIASKFVAIYEGDTLVIPHIEGQDVLTIAKVIETYNMLEPTDIITTVKVPVGYTSYEQGAIAKIEELFTDIEYLETTYEAGAMTIDFQDTMWQDVLTKMTSLNKTLDEALVYARYMASTWYNKLDTVGYLFGNDERIDHNANIIIIPPLPFENTQLTQNVFCFLQNCVYIYPITSNFSGQLDSTGRECPNLSSIEINIINTTSLNWFCAGDGVKKAIVRMGNNQQENVITGWFLHYNSTMEYLILENFKNSFDIWRSSKFTRQAIVDLINSLGTPTTTKTIFMGSINLAKLTNADIQLAYNKNWAIDPTPSAFTFAIGVNTYSCEFGMDWNKWLTSNYNVDMFDYVYKYVVDSNGNYVRKNGILVEKNDKIRYGDIFTTTPYYEVFDYEGTLPSYSAGATYYSDEECLNEVLVANLIVGTTYYTKVNWELVLAKSSITNLGSENPSDVIFTKTANFPSESEAYEEVVKDGNYFVKFTKWYKKVVADTNNNVREIYLSPYKLNSDYHLYDCFIDESGNELPYILIGKYGFTSSSQASSVSGNTVNVAIGNGRTLARALGSGYQLFDLAMYCFLKDLVLAMSETVNFVLPSYDYMGIHAWGGILDGIWGYRTANKYYYVFSTKPSKYVDSPTTSTDGYNALSYIMPWKSSYKNIKELGLDITHPTINLPIESTDDTDYTKYYCDSLFAGNTLCIYNFYADNTNSQQGPNYMLFYSTGSGVRLCYRPIE